MIIAISKSSCSSYASSDEESLKIMSLNLFISSQRSMLKPIEKQIQKYKKNSPCDFVKHLVTKGVRTVTGVVEPA
jgi:hypothetical protein